MMRHEAEKQIQALVLMGHDLHEPAAEQAVIDPGERMRDPPHALGLRNDVPWFRHVVSKADAMAWALSQE
jgi:hypothetical protein